MTVSVVISCWNGKDLLQKNLPALFKAVQNKINHISEVIVVDDGSTDESADFIKKNYPAIKLVVHPKNYGYAKLCNTGVSAAKGDLVAILNADVIPSVNFLETALPHFENSKVFSVSFNEGSHGPGKLMWEKGFMQIVPSKSGLTQAVESDWGSGGSAIFRKSVWQQLGGMDELFLPYYVEDIDIGWRAKQAGFINLWEPKAKVVHEHEQTINPENLKKYGRKNDITLIKERNHLLFTWKNINSPTRLIEHLFVYFIPRIVAHPGYLKIFFHALIRKCASRASPWRHDSAQ